MGYTASQPKDGETIMGCAHFLSGLTHWLTLDTPTEFLRPDGSKGFSRWLALCEACFRSGEDPQAMITQDLIWTGDEPFIKEAVSN